MRDEEAGVLFFSFTTYVLVLVFFSFLFCFAEHGVEWG